MRLQVKMTLLLLMPLFVLAQRPMRLNPAVSVHDLKSAQTVNQLSPELWQRMRMSQVDRTLLEKNLKLSIGFQVKDSRSYAPLVIVLESELQATVGGFQLTAIGTGDKLSVQQKNLLQSMKIGDDFNVKLKFKHKGISQNNEIAEGTSIISVLPHQTADYNGGVEAFMVYLQKNIWTVIREDPSFGTIDNVKVSFQVNKKGEVSNTKILQKASNEKANELIIQELNEMPNWTPARNVRKELIDQQVKYAFGGC